MLDPKIAKLNYNLTPGELNYILTQLIRMYWGKKPQYSTLAEITGVLENVKSEFYRRVAVPYEQEKINLHGDVY